MSPEDRDRMNKLIYEAVQSGLRQTATLQIGAAGVGTLVTMSILDWTGLVGAGMLALAGFYVLPLQRTKLKRNIRRMTEAIRKDIANVLSLNLNTEIETSLRRVNETTAPYSRFVSSEVRAVRTLSDSLASLREELADLRRYSRTRFQK